MVQANYRYYNLPRGTTQSVFIDITGQNVNKKLQNEIIERIDSKLEKGLEIKVKFFKQN